MKSCEEGYLLCNLITESQERWTTNMEVEHLCAHTVCKMVFIKGIIVIVTCVVLFSVSAAPEHPKLTTSQAITAGTPSSSEVCMRCLRIYRF